MSDYQQLNKIIKSQVKQIQAPLKLDDTLIDICNESFDQNNTKHLKPRELSKILKESKFMFEFWNY